MNKIKSTSKLDFKLTLELNEIEANALNQICKYDSKDFLKVFYEHMGKSYLEPYEDGIISLFKTVKEELDIHLYKIKKVRKVLDDKNVIINAREYQVPYDRQLSYEEIAKIYTKDKYNPEQVYSITYSRGVNNTSGIITKDQSIQVNEGMIINCMITNNA